MIAQTSSPTFLTTRAMCPPTHQNQRGKTEINWQTKMPLSARGEHGRSVAPGSVLLGGGRAAVSCLQASFSADGQAPPLEQSKWQVAEGRLCWPPAQPVMTS